MHYWTTFLGFPFMCHNTSCLALFYFLISLPYSCRSASLTSHAWPSPLSCLFFCMASLIWNAVRISTCVMFTSCSFSFFFFCRAEIVLFFLTCRLRPSAGCEWLLRQQLSSASVIRWTTWIALNKERILLSCPQRHFNRRWIFFYHLGRFCFYTRQSQPSTAMFYVTITIVDQKLLDLERVILFLFVSLFLLLPVRLLCLRRIAAGNSAPLKVLWSGNLVLKTSLAMFVFRNLLFCFFFLLEFCVNKECRFWNIVLIWHWRSVGWFDEMTNQLIAW